MVVTVSLAVALLNLLGYVPDEITNDDLFDAAIEAQRRRAANSENGEAVFDELLARRVAYREIARRTGISKSTAQRWGSKPPTTDDDENDEGGTP